MKLAVIVGARPNFIKVAPLLPVLEEAGHQVSLIHTGQHYSADMSDSLFEELGIRAPDVNFGVGSGSHAVQTAAVMVAFDAWLENHECDAVVVIGDVNSTVACALVAAKRGVKIAHVEAGLRSRDRSMPEEINRIVTDSLSDWLFTPSADADENLIAEGVDPSRIFRVGNIMVDSLMAAMSRVDPTAVREQFGMPEQFGLVTLHRPALVDKPDLFGPVLNELASLSAELPLCFPCHPRTAQRISELGFVPPSTLLLVGPTSYLESIALQDAATVVLTDSGGVQEETTCLGVRCLTLRDSTERPITVSEGTNQVIGTQPTAIRAATLAVLGATALHHRAPRPALWDGQTAKRIALHLRLDGD
jgi:UDP-N-acetylglucosamine 2-epimerase (non-hydrolysing)